MRHGEKCYSILGHKSKILIVSYMLKVQNKRKRLILKVIDKLLFVLLFPINLVRRIKKIELDDTPSFLIIRADHIGDVILSTPIYRSIKEKYPRAKISVICGSWACDILRNNPFVDKIIVIDCPWWRTTRKGTSTKNTFFRDYALFLKTVLREQYDVFIDLRGDLRQILLFGWIPFIPVRLSYGRSGGDYLLTEHIEYTYNAHQIDLNYGLLRSFEPIGKYYKTELYPSEYEMDRVNEYIKTELDNNKYITFFNGGRSKLRQLSFKQVYEIICSLVDVTKNSIVYIGGKEDKEIAERLDVILGTSKKFINACAVFNFRELHILINRANLHIGTDSSISHIAASTNTRSITIYGPLNPEQAMPLGDEKKIVYHPYPCSPCLQINCEVNRSAKIGKCIEEIKAEEVVDMAIKLLKLTF